MACCIQIKEKGGVDEFHGEFHKNPILAKAGNPPIARDIR
jgi:hypothetical protein